MHQAVLELEYSENDSCFVGVVPTVACNAAEISIATYTRVYATDCAGKNVKRSPAYKRCKKKRCEQDLNLRVQST